MLYDVPGGERPASPCSSLLSSKVNDAWYNFALTGLQLNLKATPNSRNRRGSVASSSLQTHLVNFNGGRNSPTGERGEAEMLKLECQQPSGVGGQQ